MRTPSKITNNNSQGIIFAILSCQRVLQLKFFTCTSYIDVSDIIKKMSPCTGAGQTERSAKLQYRGHFLFEDKGERAPIPRGLGGERRTGPGGCFGGLEGAGLNNFFGGRNSRTKNQPKEEVFGTDIPRTSGGHSRGYPGPKFRSGR